MKVKVISRNPNEYMRETKHDIYKLPRNYDPKLHPFEVPREYQRALNAVKLDSIFAKPFLGSLEGHTDSIQCMMKHPKSLSTLVTAAADGEIKVWNIPQRKCLRSFKGHDSIVRGLCCQSSGDHFFSLDSDAHIKQWKLNDWINSSPYDDNYEGDDEVEPVNSLIGSSVMLSLDHHRFKPLIFTAGEKVELWEETRSEPLKTFKWTCDSVHAIKFNPVEVDVACSAGSDRSIILYDVRKPTPLRKVVLNMKSNSISWNPMDAFTFTVANEDFDLYTFDMRKLKTPKQIHSDHVNAVICVDYSPTGREFVSGSYDKTVRIFNSDEGRSREVYHTQRMQRLTSVLWSLDNKYILCGSDEMDVRIWKANRSEKLGITTPREDANFKYQAKLKEKFSCHPEVRRIARYRHVPKSIYYTSKQRRIQIMARKRKEHNRRSHSKKGSMPIISEKRQRVVREDE